MTISRPDLITNLQTILQNSEGKNFAVDSDCYLTLTDKVTSQAAIKVITNTFTKAASFEEGKDRIWVEDNSKAYSIGHIIKERLNILPQEVQNLELADEEHDLLKVQVTFGENKTYVVYVEENDLKQCQTFENLPADTTHLGTVPCKCDSLSSKEQLDVAFNYIKTGILPDALSADDCVGLLRFADYLNHPDFMQELCNQLGKEPLEKKCFLSLPYELGIQWAMQRSVEECERFIKSFGGQDCEIADLGAGLINKEHLSLAAFENFEELNKVINVADINLLDLSSWENITLDAFKEIVTDCPAITELRGPESFTDAHLAHMKNFSNLQTLDLSWCEQITNDDLSHLKNLFSLQTLNLQGCHLITNGGLLHLKSLPNLQTLDLSWCEQITNDDLSHLKNLSNLQTLNLSWCRKFTDGGLKHLKDFSSLKTLNLSECTQITDVGLGHLKERSSLETLNLQECHQITDNGLVHLKDIFSLKTLSLRECYQITDGGLLHLKKLSHLQTLNLSWCGEIADSGLKHLKDLSSLKTLNLSECNPITDVGLSHLKDLSNLQTLDLSWCEQITNDGLEYLKSLSNLQTLNLSACTQITDVGLSHLKDLSNLQTLDLSECDLITNDAQTMLKKHLPRLRIV